MNHELRMYNKMNGKLEVQEVASAQILTVSLSIDETIVTVGCANGAMIVYEVEIDGSKVYLHKVHT
jgi:hypothetical protein